MLKHAKLVKLGGGVLLAIMLFSLWSFRPSGAIEYLSLDLVSKSLFQGKSISASGTVYYRSEGGLMVTHMTSPIEQLSFVNALGELKNYDPKSNTVTLIQGADLSSKNSFIYSFLNGKTGDLGIADLGFRLKSTKTDQGVLVQTFVPRTDMGTVAQKVEIASENNLPIFVGFYGQDDKPMMKTYYTNYQQLGYLKMPLTITEIEYMTPKDSAITKRIYSNQKLNNQVDKSWLNYQIPTSAKVINPDNKSK